MCILLMASIKNYIHDDIRQKDLKSNLLCCDCLKINNSKPQRLKITQRLKLKKNYINYSCHENKHQFRNAFEVNILLCCEA